MAILSLAVGADANPPQPGKIPASHVRPDNVPVAAIAARGDFAMQAGQNAEAIVAFEKVLKLESSRGPVWGKLAYLYLKEGNSAKAVEAFKKAKLLSDANGGIVTRDGARGLWLP